MGDLGGHRTDQSETFRLAFGMFQPFPLFDFRPQRGSSALDCLLEIIVRTAKRGQEPDNDEKEHKKHDGVPNGNQRMLIRRPAEHVAEEPCTSTERSHCESRRAPGHPSREACGQQVKSRYCPFATRKIIHKAENGCQRHSSGSRNHLRSHTKLSPWIHWNSVLQNFDKTARNFVHGRFVSCVTNGAKIDMFDKGRHDLQPRKLEKSSAPVNSYSRLSAGLIGHPLPLFLWRMATLSLSH